MDRTNIVLVLIFAANVRLCSLVKNERNTVHEIRLPTLTFFGITSLNVEEILFIYLPSLMRVACASTTERFSQNEYIFSEFSEFFVFSPVSGVK